MRFLTGSYTRLGGKGVTLWEMDADFAAIQSQINLLNPTYVILTPDKKGFVTVGKNESLNRGYIAQYAFTDTGFTFVTKAYIGRNGACHMTYSPDGNTLYTANYATGSISVLPVQNGCVTDAVQVIDHTDVLGKDAHMHHVSFLPNADNLLVGVDLGCDSLYFYQRDALSGLLTRKNRFRFHNGTGPRHLAYTENGNRVYIAHELANRVSFLEKAQDTYIEKQSLSTLPDGFADFSACGAIRLTQDAKQLYVTNRGHDSIAILDIGSDGMLALNRILPAYGKFPRDCAILQDGSVLCANQNSGTVTHVSYDGALLQEIPVPGAVCICPIA